MVSKGKDLFSLKKTAMHEKWILASEFTVHVIVQRLTAHESEEEILSCSQSKGKMVSEPLWGLAEVWYGSSTLTQA